LRRLLAPDSPLAVVGVVTQPDRPVGRSARPAPPPVKTLAQEHGLPVLQPPSLRRPAALAALARLRPEVGIVAAYGAILRPDVLDLPAAGYLNVHASLLPRWRGAWPVGAAILAGDAETGATIMRLDAGMDTGPVLARRPTPILPQDTTASLQERLATLGADLLVEVLPAYLAGRLVPEPQDDRAATYSQMVRKEDGRLDWSRPAPELERQVRAMQPWPVAWTVWGDKTLRVLAAHVLPEGPEGAPAEEAEPGRVVRHGGQHGSGVAVATGAGWLGLDRLQLEGRGAVSGEAFVNGYRTFPGSVLGAPPA
jgi:methionyl-tRNA formyltransferase